MSVTVNGMYVRNGEYDSLLEAFDKEHVFKIEKGYYGGTDTWSLRERCDDYFCIVVTPDMIRKLAHELLAKADEMETT